MHSATRLTNYDSKFRKAPPVAGWLTDHMGAEWVSFICLFFSVPCWIAVAIRANLAFFVIAFAFESGS